MTSCPTCGRPFDGSESQAAFPREPSQNHQPSASELLNKATSLVPRLSAELLSRIFISCVASLPTCKFPDVDYDNKTISLALRLGSVCQKWRDVTLKTPQLWNTVHLSGSLPVEIAEFWLSRSAPLPLDVQFHIPPEVNIHAEEDEDAEEEEVEDMVDVRSIITEINRHVSRWRSVHFSIHPPMLSWFSFSQEATKPQHLDVLSLCLYSEEGDEVDVELQGVVASKLYIMGHIEEIGTQWSNLTHLAFRNTTVRRCYDVLNVAREIRFCSFDTVSDDDEFTVKHPLKLSSLDTLHLEHYPNSFFDCFSFPALQTLHVLAMEAKPLVSVRSALGRSKCHLKDLGILNENDQSEIIETLNLVPSVERLHIRGFSLTDAFFEHMKATATTSGNPNRLFLPELQSLNLDLRSKRAFNWTSISRILAPSSSTNTGSCRPLRSVEISFFGLCTGKDEVIDREALQEIRKSRADGADVRVFDSKGVDIVERSEKRRGGNDGGRE